MLIILLFFSNMLLADMSVCFERTFSYSNDIVYWSVTLQYTDGGGLPQEKYENFAEHVPFWLFMLKVFSVLKKGWQ